MMDMSLNGWRALVAGATGGIAKVLARLGAGIGPRTAERVDAAIAGLPAEAAADEVFAVVGDGVLRNVAQRPISQAAAKPPRSGGSGGGLRP